MYFSTFMYVSVIFDKNQSSIIIFMNHAHLEHQRLYVSTLDHVDIIVKVTSRYYTQTMYIVCRLEDAKWSLH